MMKTTLILGIVILGGCLVGCGSSGEMSSADEAKLKAKLDGPSAIPGGGTPKPAKKKAGTETPPPATGQ